MGARAIEAARRLLRLNGHFYDHRYCNDHEGERGISEKCPGCLATKADREAVRELGLPDRAEFEKALDEFGDAWYWAEEGRIDRRVAARARLLTLVYGEDK